MRSSCVIKGTKMAVELVVMPRLISMPLWPSGRLERKPSSCWKSSRFKVQLYFWTIPDTVNRSLSSSRRVGAMFTTRKVSRNILSFRLCKSSRRVFASLLYVTRSGGSMSMSYPDRAAFFCSSTFILSMSETLALMDFTAAA